MSVLQPSIDRLAAADRWNYRAAPESASEPAAWAALALLAHGRAESALKPAHWLAGLQQADGSVGVTAAEIEPRWPTSLALWAWCALDEVDKDKPFRNHIQAAATWCLAARGETAPRSPQIGHDTELTGWSWAAKTHSWLEPTCFFVLGLRAAGYGDHPRVREGVRLIVDRLLPAGGANYGNTIVLGQALLPHLQPTGLAMLALGGEQAKDPRVAKSLDYLERSIRPRTAPASLACSCLGLAAHGRRSPRFSAWLPAALGDESRGPLAIYEQALLLFAARRDSTLTPPIGEAKAP